MTAVIGSNYFYHIYIFMCKGWATADYPLSGSFIGKHYRNKGNFSTIKAHHGQSPWTSLINYQFDSNKCPFVLSYACHGVPLAVLARMLDVFR